MSDEQLTEQQSPVTAQEALRAFRERRTNGQVSNLPLTADAVQARTPAIASTERVIRPLRDDTVVAGPVLGAMLIEAEGLCAWFVDRDAQVTKVGHSSVRTHASQRTMETVR